MTKKKLEILVEQLEKRIENLERNPIAPFFGPTEPAQSPQYPWVQPPVIY